MFPSPSLLNSRVHTRSLSPHCMVNAREVGRRTGGKKCKLAPILERKRAAFNMTLMSNHARMNESFSNWLQTYNQESRKWGQQHKRLKQIQPQVIQRVEHNKENEDSTWDHSRLSVHRETVVCYDSIFPTYRPGATLAAHEDLLYIFGGIVNLDVELHCFKEGGDRWIKVQDSITDKPAQMPSFHTIQPYKQYLFFIGGVSIDVSKNRRYFNSSINIFDTNKKEWSKLKWNICLRSHTSIICGNMLIVYGGLNEKEQYLSTFHFLSLNQNRITQSIPLSIQIPTFKDRGLAFHQMISTHDLRSEVRHKVNLDAAICFGGKYADGSLLEEALVFKLNFLDHNWEGEVEGHQWETLGVKGTKPPPRHSHSMTLIEARGLCLVIGGLDSEGSVLGDAWVLDLLTMSWVKTVFDTGASLVHHIGAHTATCLNNIVYLYQDNTFITFSFSSDLSKKQLQKHSLFKPKRKTKISEMHFLNY